MTNLDHLRIITVSKLILCFFAVAQASSVIVDSSFGKIKGKIVSNTPNGNDKSYVVFRNIPYAKPPVGDLRFAKPRPHPKLNGVFDATDDKVVSCVTPDAVQFSISKESEDCLILTIYAKNKPISGDNLKKVIVFIHGGSFIFGTSDLFQMGSFTSTHDVIGVAINYRLGVLGFLSTGNEASPGNYGLWDQRLAIQWVKNNIKAFGGDPDDITLSGQSAGGASVAYHTISPLTKELFSKAYLISGAATSAFARAIEVKKHALMFGQHTNCWNGEISDKLDLKDSERLVECLRNVDGSYFHSFMSLSNLEPMFVPSVDGDFVPSEPILLLRNESYLESIGFYNKSYLVSIVNNELKFMEVILSSEREGFVNNSETIEEREDAVLKYDEGIKSYATKSRLNTDESSPSVTERVTDFYSRRYVGDNALFTMITDLNFLIPAKDFLRATSAQGGCKAWLLYFNHFPDFLKAKSYKGIIHGVDLLYWLDNKKKDMKSLEINEEEEEEEGDEPDGMDLQMRDSFSFVVAEFIKNGDPSGAVNDRLAEEWPPFMPNDGGYLNFNPIPFVASHLEREKEIFWLTTIPNLMNETMPEN